MELYNSIKFEHTVEMENIFPTFSNISCSSVERGGNKIKQFHCVQFCAFVYIFIIASK